MLSRNTPTVVSIQPLLDTLRKDGVDQDALADALAESIAHAIVFGAQNIAPAFGVELAGVVRTRLIAADRQRSALGVQPRGRLPGADIGFAGDAARLWLRAAEARAIRGGPEGLYALCASMADELASRAGDETGALGLVRAIERWRRIIESGTADPDSRDPAIPAYLN